ncbi:hypothetical protein AJ80_02863 [Polytolypa hystricis UAMH7299]|uniref:Uncharacterized protein n=1 Tax=Polytolypa hystricis (strain UAMH7299) TaxID=1447883 RepID=A0A2B7YPX7_POLH7|nr:hypothetical protein AJ80_02863 [Polytolypa hystricis UAMH7299]
MSPSKKPAQPYTKRKPRQPKKDEERFASYTEEAGLIARRRPSIPTLERASTNPSPYSSTVPQGYRPQQGTVPQNFQYFSGEGTGSQGPPSFGQEPLNTYRIHQPYLQHTSSFGEVIGSQGPQSFGQESLNSHERHQLYPQSALHFSREVIGSQGVQSFGQEPLNTYGIHSQPASHFGREVIGSQGPQSFDQESFNSHERHQLYPQSALHFNTYGIHQPYPQPFPQLQDLSSPGLIMPSSPAKHRSLPPASAEDLSQLEFLIDPTILDRPQHESDNSPPTLEPTFPIRSPFLNQPSLVSDTVPQPAELHHQSAVSQSWENEFLNNSPTLESIGRHGQSPPPFLDQSSQAPDMVPQPAELHHQPAIPLQGQDPRMVSPSTTDHLGQGAVVRLGGVPIQRRHRRRDDEYSSVYGYGWEGQEYRNYLKGVEATDDNVTRGVHEAVNELELQPQQVVDSTRSRIPSRFYALIYPLARSSLVFIRYCYVFFQSFSSMLFDSTLVLS